MSFHNLAQLMVENSHAWDVAPHYHLWHVALAFLLPACALMFAGVAVLDLRRKVRIRDSENMKFRAQLAEQQAAGRQLIVNLGIVADDCAGILSGLQEDARPQVRAAGKDTLQQIGKIRAALAIVRGIMARHQREIREMDERRQELEQVNIANIESARDLRTASDALAARERTVAATVALSASPGDDDPVLNSRGREVEYCTPLFSLPVGLPVLTWTFFPVMIFGSFEVIG